MYYFFYTYFRTQLLFRWQQTAPKLTELCNHLHTHCFFFIGLFPSLYTNDKKIWYYHKTKISPATTTGQTKYKAGFVTSDRDLTNNTSQFINFLTDYNTKTNISSNLIADKLNLIRTSQRFITNQKFTDI